MDKQKFVEQFDLALLSNFNSEQIQIIESTLLSVIKDYNINFAPTEIVVYDGGNDELIANYVGCMIISGKAKTTIKQYTRELNKFIKSHGKNLLEITPMDIRIYLAEMITRGVSKRTAANSRCYLSSFYAWAVKDGLIEKNPCDSVERVKYEKKKKTSFSEVELDKIRTVDSLSVRDRAIIECLYSSGLRISELCNLNRNDVDLQSLRVFVRQGKGGKDRITYINKVAAFHLGNYLATRTDDKEPLFLSQPKRQIQYQNRIDSSSVRKILTKVSKRAKVTNIHPHRFRRTFATTMYNRGMELRDVQKLLGHSGITTTMGYIDSNDTGLESAYMKHMV